LVLADVGNDLDTPLELHLENPNDTVVLELLADRPHEYWAHLDLPQERVLWKMPENDREL
jgi:hypothetical protein